MGERKQLALFFTYNENWIGGTYYYLNLVNALNVLPDEIKPAITIISNTVSSYHFIKDQSAYPYLKFMKNKSGKPLWEKAINAFSLRLLKKKWIDPRLPDQFDLLFPASGGGDYLSLIDDDKKADWIADFQEFHLPQFFSVNEIVEIKQRQIAQSYFAKKLVLSSLDAKKDFETIYPHSKARIFVIPFTVTHPDLSGVDIESINQKHSLNRPYFYSPNQYWAHKNHQVLIQAVNLLVKSGKDILVALSGKESDYRNPNYTQDLKKQVIDLGLEKNILFLGFLDRKDQLVIMKQAIAVVQPSLFEGWSTVVEDAKALNKYVIASDLNVHREQLDCNCSFFNPHSPEELALLIGNPTQIAVEPFNYDNNRLVHAEAFLKLF